MQTAFGIRFSAMPTKSKDQTYRLANERRQRLQLEDAKREALRSASAALATFSRNQTYRLSAGSRFLPTSNRGGNRLLVASPLLAGNTQILKELACQI